MNRSNSTTYGFYHPQKTSVPTAVSRAVSHLQVGGSLYRLHHLLHLNEVRTPRRGRLFDVFSAHHQHQENITIWSRVAEDIVELDQAGFDSAHHADIIVTWSNIISAATSKAFSHCSNVN